MGNWGLVYISSVQWIAMSFVTNMLVLGEVLCTGLLVDPNYSSLSLCVNKY